MASSRANVRAVAALEDTLYVGNMRGVERIYQQPFIDIYAKSPSPSSTTARRRSPPISSTNQRNRSA
jgi:hypothetical protein